MGTVCMAASSSTSSAERPNGGGCYGPPPLRAAKLVQQIREEFEYFAGLRLTASEAASFWALDPSSTERVLTELTAAGFLTRDGSRYRKRSA